MTHQKENNGENKNSETNVLSKVKISNELFEKISKMLLSTIKVDEYTRKVIEEQIINTGHYSYINLLRKYNSFLTPIRLMILVDYVNILDAFKYYLNEHDPMEYNDDLSRNYNLITGLQEAELKIIMLEHIYEMLGGTPNIMALFHEPQEKVDIIIELDKQIKTPLVDNDGYMYISTLNPGKYMFESRSCCSITDKDYILDNEKRMEKLKDCDRYFIFVPNNTTIYEEVNRELEKNNIKILFSNYSTIDIVNDVSFMEGILRKNNVKKDEGGNNE